MLRSARPPASYLPSARLAIVATILLFGPTAAHAQVITPIHDIQGPGASSPIVASSATIEGIVTGVKANGFFVQEGSLVGGSPIEIAGFFAYDPVFRGGVRMAK